MATAKKAPTPAEKFYGDLDRTKGVWPTHFGLNDAAFWNFAQQIIDLGQASATSGATAKIPGFNKKGTVGIAPQDVINYMGEGAYGYDVATGRAIGPSGDPDLVDYARQISGGNAASFLMAVAQEQKTSLPALITRIQQEGLSTIMPGFCANQKATLEHALLMNQVATSLPITDPKKMDASVKELAKLDPGNAYGLLGLGPGELPMGLVNYGMKRLHA